MMKKSEMQKQTEQKVLKQQECHDSDSGGSDGDEYLDSPKIIQKKSLNVQRNSVSAESYGNYNKKENFVFKFFEKSAEQNQKILLRLNQAFMFSALDDKEKQIVINAMKVVKFSKDECVIKQGEEGNVLYVVDSGTLDCFKKLSGNPEPTFLKKYIPGESFGELALLYNAPRAATIIAKEDCTLFELDRQTFNHIVKDAAQRKREKYENFLLKVKLLEQLDPYERIRIADALSEMDYKQGEYISKFIRISKSYNLCKLIKGEEGKYFYFLESGEAYAKKYIDNEKTEKVVLEYKPGDYFGELALLNDTTRQASIIAKTPAKVIYLDKDSFNRLLGSLVEIFQKNSERYAYYKKNFQ